MEFRQRIVFFLLVFSVGSGTLFVVTENQLKNKTMALVGREVITLKDIAYRTKIDQCYEQEKVGQEISLIELVNQFLEKEVLRQNFQFEVPEKVLQEKSDWVDKNTKAPVALECIKDIFGLDKKSYWRLYISPTLVNPKLYSLFSLSEDIHQEERARIKTIKKEFEQNKKDLNDFEEYQKWEVEKKESRVPDVLKEVDVRFQPDPLLEEVLGKLKAGEIWPKIIEDDYSFKIVRLLKEDKDKYYLDGVVVKKKSFDDWFQGFVKKNIKIEIKDSNLKQKIFRDYPDLWWLEVVN